VTENRRYASLQHFIQSVLKIRSLRSGNSRFERNCRLNQWISGGNFTLADSLKRPVELRCDFSPRLNTWPHLIDKLKFENIVSILWKMRDITPHAGESLSRPTSDILERRVHESDNEFILERRTPRNGQNNCVGSTLLNGGGIPSNTQAIFEEFRQVEQRGQITNWHGAGNSPTADRRAGAAKIFVQSTVRGGRLFSILPNQ